MIFNEEKWEKVSNYLISQIREYCAKNHFDKEDFAKRLGLSSRVLTRLYSKKTHSTAIKNNRLLSSLEFFYALANSLEIDVVRMISDINIFASDKKDADRKTDYSFFEKNMIDIIREDLLKIFNSTEKTNALYKKLSLLINLSFILVYTDNKTILKIVEMIKEFYSSSLHTINNKTIINNFLAMVENEFK